MIHEHLIFVVVFDIILCVYVICFSGVDPYLFGIKK